METMTVLMTLWAVLTTVLVILLIYRSALSMHEDDQLFLNDAESHLEQEQKELSARMDRINPYLKVLSASSGVLVLVMAALWLWRGWNRM
jgi:hypothetical protein